MGTSIRVQQRFQLAAVVASAATLCCLVVGCYGSGLAGCAYLVLAALLACACLSDLRRMVIPNAVSVAIVAVWIAYTAVRALGVSSGGSALSLACGFEQPWLTEALQGLFGSLAAFAVVLTLVLLFEAFSGGLGLGGGDLKLLLAAGLFMGFTMTLACLFLACIMAVLVSALGRRSGMFPFGPYLCASCMMTLLCGPLVLDGFFYLGMGVLV